MNPIFSNTAEITFHLTDILEALLSIADQCGNKQLDADLNEVAVRLGKIVDRLDMELEAEVLFGQDTRAEGRIH